MTWDLLAAALILAALIGALAAAVIYGHPAGTP